MHLRTSIVAVVIAAAAGAAGARALGSAHPGPAPGPPAVAFGSSAESEAVGRDTGVARGRPLRQIARPISTTVVYVAGAVRNPGVYTLPQAARATDALHAAGGPTAEADLVAVDLAERLEDGQEIAVPVRGAPSIAGGKGDAGSVAASRRRGKRATKRKGRHGRRHQKAPAASNGDSSSDVPTEIVNVNSADEATLETLPGIGPSLAQRVIAFRDLNGPFASTDELLDVGGMTAGKVDALASYVTF